MGFALQVPDTVVAEVQTTLAACVQVIERVALLDSVSAKAAVDAAASACPVDLEA